LDGAPELEVVRAKVAAILAGESDGDASPPAALPSPAVPRILVGHGLENDLKVLHISHPLALLRASVVAQGYVAQALRDLAAGAITATLLFTP
jgi:hypothetical protein